jgi:Protein of unknown function (DUF2934)
MNDEDLIRDPAYRLWEDEGRPDGRAEAHWYQARDMIRDEESQKRATARPAVSAPAAPAAKAEPAKPPAKARTAVPRAQELETVGAGSAKPPNDKPQPRRR